MSVSKPRPGRAAALDQLDDRGDVHRAFDRGAAGFALALPVVPVAEREQCAFDVDPQIAGCARNHLGGVHVAAERIGHQRTAHFAACRRHADGAEHRIGRQRHLEVAALRGEAQRACGRVVFVDPGALGQRGCSVGLAGMLVRPPKNGISVDAPQLRAGVRSTRWIASVSPGSAPSIQNGPVWG